MTAFDIAWELMKSPYFENDSGLYQEDQAPTKGAVPAWNMEIAMPGIWGGRLNDYISDYYNNPDAQQETLEALKRIHMNPYEQITIYRAIPDDLEGEQRINEGDWVTLSEAYAHEHGNDYLGGNYEIVEEEVNAHDLFTHGDSIHEFGWVGDRNRFNDEEVQALIREHYDPDKEIEDWDWDWRLRHNDGF